MLEQHQSITAGKSAVHAQGHGEAVTGGAEFLTFRLGAEEYGIDILKVQEIRGYEKPTTIANAPAFIKGVINLRGAIVPIVDLRLKFALDEARYDAFTVVIKSLEANYRRVPGVSGATIMGDGRVALILDTAHLLALSHPAFARAA